jgi:hypothetical protein
MFLGDAHGSCWTSCARSSMSELLEVLACEVGGGWHNQHVRACDTLNLLELSAQLQALGALPMPTPHMPSLVSADGIWRLEITAGATNGRATLFLPATSDSLVACN